MATKRHQLGSYGRCKRQYVPAAPNLKHAGPSLTSGIVGRMGGATETATPGDERSPGDNGQGSRAGGLAANHRAASKRWPARPRSKCRAGVHPMVAAANHSERLFSATDCARRQRTARYPLLTTTGITSQPLAVRQACRPFGCSLPAILAKCAHRGTSSHSGDQHLDGKTIHPSDRPEEKKKRRIKDLAIC